MFTPSLWRRRGRVWFRPSEWMSEMSDVFGLFDFVMAPLQCGWVQGFSILNSPILNSSNSCMLRFYPRTWVHFVWNGTGHDRGAECPAAALSEGNARCPNTQTRFGPVRPSSVRFAWCHKEVYGRVESSSGSVWLLRPSVSFTLAAPHVSVFAFICSSISAYTRNVMSFKSLNQFKAINNYT